MPLRTSFWLAVLFALGLFAAGGSGNAAADFDGATTEPVGQLGTNLFATPVHQHLTPAGRQLELPRLRPQAIALSPSGKLLAVSGKSAELVLANPATGEVRQHAPLPLGRGEQEPDVVSTHILQPDKDAVLSYGGLVFSPDGARIFLSSANGTIKVFAVNSLGEVSPLDSFALPRANAPRRRLEIPAGLAISADGKRLYVALNLSNRLGELDAQTGRLLRTWEVGVAPCDVVLAGTKVYVSNWGGRRPDEQSLTGPAGHGMTVRVDPVRYIANEGSVSVIDLAPAASPESPHEVSSIPAGLHSSAMALSPNRRYLAVANAGSDTVTVVDTRNDQIVETIWTRQTPADLFGASPNALTFDRSGRRLYVCNGTQNAVAVVQFAPGRSRMLGLIPVGWFPGAIAFDARRDSLYVANLKGHGATQRFQPDEPIKLNSRQYFGTVSMVRIPSAKLLAQHTGTALRNLRYPLLAAARQPARPQQTPRPVPERVGEPSVFQHVVYIIKENRTYDQVLGDVLAGNGSASLCTFGERITPNQHKLVREFVLLDNTYCCGNVSADGHQWTDSAMVTDYLEKSFGGFPRSYPDGMGDDEVDALAYSPAGFLWDNALAHGKTLRDYGEFAITEKTWPDGSTNPPIRFLDHWRDFTNGTPAIRVWSRPAIESLRSNLCTETVGWDLDIPDVFRARQFIKELRDFEAKGSLPNLIFICLPNDHTSGTDPDSATPAAQVADNDLAFGQIVQALSHSRFWPQTCIFAIEDDPQAGWDHVSGYRTTAYVISPYTKRGQVVSTQYNQTSVVRTIELMLGLPPMNQFDATATPMSDCFVEAPNLSPYAALTNNVPLDQINPRPKKLSDALLRRDAEVSARLPLGTPDRCPEDVLNRILWHAMKGTRTPYPTWAVTPVEDKD